MTEPEPAAPLPPEHEGRFLPWGVLLGAVLIPLAVLGVMQIVNVVVFECRNGGAEDSLSCVLRAIAITAMSIPVGAMVGFFCGALGREAGAGKGWRPVINPEPAEIPLSPENIDIVQAWGSRRGRTQ